MLLDQISNDEVFEKAENQKFSEQLQQLELKSNEQIRRTPGRVRPEFEAMSSVRIRNLNPWNQTGKI